MSGTKLGDAIYANVADVIFSAYYPGYRVKMTVVEPAQPTTRDPHYPHDCPGCGGPSYIGLSVDCLGKCGR